jgi:hypothetical protein
MAVFDQASPLECIERPENLMLPTHYLETILHNTPAQLRDIVLELRNLIASVAPTACEKAHPKGFTYFDAGRGGPVSAGICQIALHQDHVRLAFVHGAFLPDPRHLLEGDRIAKRYIRIYSYDDAPWDYLKQLITDSASFDPYSLIPQSP